MNFCTRTCVHNDNLWFRQSYNKSQKCSIYSSQKLTRSSYALSTSMHRCHEVGFGSSATFMPIVLPLHTQWITNKFITGSKQELQMLGQFSNTAMHSSRERRVSWSQNDVAKHHLLLQHLSSSCPFAISHERKLQRPNFEHTFRQFSSISMSFFSREQRILDCIDVGWDAGLDFPTPFEPSSFVTSHEIKFQNNKK